MKKNKKHAILIISVCLFVFIFSSFVFLCSYRRLSVEVSYIYPSGGEEIFGCWDWVTIYRIESIDDLQYIHEVKELYKKGDIDYIRVMEKIQELSLQDEKKIKLSETGKFNCWVSLGSKLIVLSNKDYGWYEVGYINKNNTVIRLNNENVIER